MKVGVMQPYFFPYIGYWQLLGAVDKYVIFDDVNYIKRGWINRNQILYQGKVKFFNVYLKGVSQNKYINDIEVSDNGLNHKNLRILQEAYKKAPFFDDVYPIIEKIICQKEKNLARYNGFLLKVVCEYLEIKTKLFYSSEIEKDPKLKGQKKIMDICKKLCATEYYNAIGGQKLYDREYFVANGMKLYFLKKDDIKYQQFGEQFFDNLSIIDVMMFNPVDRIQELLSKYSLVEG